MSSTTAPIERPRISACIIAFNEAGRIGDCLASLAFCDEIVVVDSQSTDATVAIAESAGARVLQRRFEGFRSQKAFCVEQASHDWYHLRHQEALTSDAVVRLAEAAADKYGFKDLENII